MRTQGIYLWKGDVQDNPKYIPPEGVIGYDFFANFTLVVDRFG